MAYLKAAIVVILGVYFKVICRLQSFANGMISSCKIFGVVWEVRGHQGHRQHSHSIELI